MKTIEVTDDMYEFLMDLSKELTSQDNRATAMPYFFQVQEKKEVPTAEGMGETVWVLDGEICLRTEEDIKRAVFEHKGWAKGSQNHEAEYEDLLAWDIEDILGPQCGYQKYEVSIEPTYSNAFLTEKACKEHIGLNNYHYKEPTDFLSHAFRNPELEKVMEFICSISGGKLHK